MARRSRGEGHALPGWVEPMLAKPDGGTLPTGARWAYEYKMDGYRCCYRVAANGTTALTSRNNKDLTEEFADLAGGLTEALGGRAAVLDGEVVACGPDGRIDFELLQQRRGHYQRTGSAPAGATPRFLAFDLLLLDDEDLTGLPYDERRALLAALDLPDPDRIGVVPSFTAADGTPDELLERAAAEGFEGLVAKLRSSGYQPGRRSDGWLKHPLVHTTEVIIAGWRPGQGRFTGVLGGLMLGAHDPVTGDLIYVGDVGTGFSFADRARLQGILEPLGRRTHPFAVSPPREDTVRARWVRPELVGEVVYRTITRDAVRLRHTAWRGLRDDRSPEEVVFPVSATPAQPVAPVPKAAMSKPPSPPEERITVQVADRQLTLSNLGKPLFPDGFTKGEVLDYYSRIAPMMLPYLRDRPVTFIRFPDGVLGQQWFGKNVPRGAPSWLRTVRLAHAGSRGDGEPVEYPLLDGLPALVWAANIAALELHVPQWTVGSRGARRPPDRLVFDLDPGPETTIVDCCRIAERLRELLVADGLVPFATTSGSKGMQLYCAIRTRDPEAPSAYAKKLAQHLARETPDEVTAVMAKAKREGRVFVDWSQNNPAKTTICPYSLRGRDEPTVATPITWHEVEACRDPGNLRFTADDVLARTAELGDLFAGLEDARGPLPRRQAS